MGDDFEIKISSTAWWKLQNIFPKNEKISAIASEMIKRYAEIAHDIITDYLNIDLSEFHSLNINKETWSVLEETKKKENEDIDSIASKLVLYGCREIERINKSNKNFGIWKSGEICEIWKSPIWKPPAEKSFTTLIARPLKPREKIIHRNSLFRQKRLINRFGLRGNKHKKSHTLEAIPMIGLRRCIPVVKNGASLLLYDANIKLSNGEKKGRSKQRASKITILDNGEIVFVKNEDSSTRLLSDKKVKGQDTKITKEKSNKQPKRG